jgi:hypothetical protein
LAKASLMASDGFAEKVNSLFVISGFKDPVCRPGMWPTLMVWADALTEQDEWAGECLRWCSTNRRYPLGSEAQGVWWFSDRGGRLPFYANWVPWTVGRLILRRPDGCNLSVRYRSAAEAYMALARAWSRRRRQGWRGAAPSLKAGAS